MKTTELLLFIITLSWVFLVYKLSTTINTHPISTPSSIQQQQQQPSPPLQSQTTETTINNNDIYSLAKSQSFGFFDDISPSQWKRLQQIFIEHENHKHPDKPFVFHPQASEKQSVPEVYKNRRGHKGWSSYAAWYQTVRRFFNLWTYIGMVYMSLTFFCVVFK